VRVALKCGVPERAELTARAARRLAEQNPHVPSLSASADHAEGVLHNDLEALRRAVDGYATSPRALDCAAALEDAADAERQASHGDRAVALLHEALIMYSRSGAIRHARRVDRRLQRLGATATPRLPRPRSPLQCLTPSEKRVAALLTEGLTNRQIATRLSISPHTVDSHVRHCFAKLGVGSRVELTRLIVSQQNGRKLT
jgi:DNA-binding NarL/FixJ family response regulator